MVDKNSAYGDRLFSKSDLFSTHICLLISGQAIRCIAIVLRIVNSQDYPYLKAIPVKTLNLLLLLQKQVYASFKDVDLQSFFA